MFKTAAALLTVLVLIAVLGVPPANAADDKWQDTRIITDKFNVTLGGYLVDLKTDAGVGTSSGLGATIRLEDDLGVDDNKSTFRLGGFYRFKPKHSLNFAFIQINRSGVTVLDEQIEFKDEIFIAQGEVASEFDVNAVALAYQYSFVNTNRTEAGFSAGLSTYDFNIALTGDVEVTNVGRQISEQGRADEGVIAPIPTIGLFVRHAITPKLVVGLRASFLNLDVGDFLGRVVDSGVTFDWFFSKHVGIGVGTNTSDIQFESTGGDNPFRVAYRQSGFTGYLSFGF